MIIWIIFISILLFKLFNFLKEEKIEYENHLILNDLKKELVKIESKEYYYTFWTYSKPYEVVKYKRNVSYVNNFQCEVEKVTEYCPIEFKRKVLELVPELNMPQKRINKLKRLYGL
jgi:hypothetical protein